MIRKLALIFIVTAPLAAQPMTIEGTICRINRAADRMIVASDAGPRLRVIATSAQVTFEGIDYEREDLRPGDRIRLLGNRNGATIRATVIDARVRPVDAASGSLFPTKIIVGRFIETDGELITLNVAGPNVMRFKGSGSFKPGDLLAVGETVTVITDREDAACQSDARHGESKDDTAAREGAEREFLHWLR